MSNITKKDGGYVAVFTRGAGRTRYRKQKKFSRKVDAEAWLTEFETSFTGALSSKKADWTLSEYYKNWIDMYKRPVVSLSTLDNYINSYRRISGHFLGSVKMKDLNRDIIQTYFNDLSKSHATARKDLTSLRSCMRDAFSDGVIQRNPMAGNINIIADPKLTKGKDRKFMATRDFRKIQKFLLGYDYKLLDVNLVVLMVIAHTALRVGECLALREDDIDSLHGTIRIDQSWDSKHKTLKDPKTENSIRVIPIPREAMQKLEIWINYHRKELFKRGISNPKRLLFLNYKGILPMAASINSTYQVVQKNLGLTGVFSTHTMRHTIASMMLSSGEVSMPYITHYLGHSSVMITQKYYIGLLPDKVEDEDRKAVSLVSSN